MFAEKTTTELFDKIHAFLEDASGPDGRELREALGEILARYQYAQAQLARIVDIALKPNTGANDGA